MRGAQRNLSKCLEEAALMKREPLDDNGIFNMGFTSSSQGQIQQIPKMLNNQEDVSGLQTIFQSISQAADTEVLSGNQLSKLEYDKLIGVDSRLLDPVDIKVEEQSELSCHGQNSGFESNDCENFIKKKLGDDNDIAMINCSNGLSEQFSQYQKLPFSTLINPTDLIVSSTSTVSSSTLTTVAAVSSPSLHNSVVNNGYDLSSMISSTASTAQSSSHNQSDMQQNNTTLVNNINALVNANECNDNKPMAEFNRISDTNLAAFSNINSNPEIRHSPLQDTINLSPTVYNCKYIIDIIFIFYVYLTK